MSPAEPESPAAEAPSGSDPNDVAPAAATAPAAGQPVSVTPVSGAGSSWKLGRRATGCAGCESAFAPGAEVTSALRKSDEGFDRRDWCASCFEKVRDSAFSWWTARLPLESEKKPTFDLSVAREFLTRLLAENDDQRAALRYLLVLLLMRKRIVKLHEQEQRDGVDIMTITIPPSDDPHEIPCPPIDEAEADSLREELGRLFDL